MTNNFNETRKKYYLKDTEFKAINNSHLKVINDVLDDGLMEDLNYVKIKCIGLRKPMNIVSFR